MKTYVAAQVCPSASRWTAQEPVSKNLFKGFKEIFSALNLCEYIFVDIA